jgi:tetratricopeptide (TPR) repeat protein
MTSWAEIKSTSQHLNDVGKYDDAIKILEEFLEAAQGDERLYATAELGTVLTNQGCLKAALDILENILETDAALYPADHPLCLQLRMQACRLRPIVKASFNGVLHDASDIHKTFYALEDIGEMNHFTVSWFQTC